MQVLVYVESGYRQLAAGGDWSSSAATGIKWRDVFLNRSSSSFEMRSAWRISSSTSPFGLQRDSFEVALLSRNNDTADP